LFLPVAQQDPHHRSVVLYRLHGRARSNYPPKIASNTELRSIATATTLPIDLPIAAARLGYCRQASGLKESAISEKPVQTMKLRTPEFHWETAPLGGFPLFYRDPLGICFLV
jgi:hypothetical protein